MKMDAGKLGAVMAELMEDTPKLKHFMAIAQRFRDFEDDPDSLLAYLGTLGQSDRELIRRFGDAGGYDMSKLDALPLAEESTAIQ